MFNKLLKKDEGFTLIEIVLVLAIAGLIMVIVFLAVSGAQRARRDTQRKNDAARYLAAAEQFASNNNGTFPGVSIVGTYLTTGGSTFADPSDQTTYVVTVGVGVPSGPHQISASSNAQCTTGAIATGGGAGQFAVAVYQENGAQYCVSNK